MNKLLKYLYNFKIFIYSGNSWFQGITPFKSNSKHQIMFEGIRGDNDLGDIVGDKFFENF